MLHRVLLLATAISASVVLAACSDTTAPPQLVPGVEFARSGIFRVVKNCSDYHGLAGETCTIRSSTLKQLEGATITYASGADLNGFLNTDVVLDPPGPGNNAAFGHCELSLVTGIGVCTFSGGTGKFTWFHARADVSPLGDFNFAWDGTYSFSPKE
ncbi:MAG TPA: hypothetical protein VGR09_13730 [Gemmatimonadales bacterium]|nr:hypothetical protein [Gemmatimonadales bacterium]